VTETETGQPFYSDAHRALQDRFDTRRLADRLVEVIVTDTFTDAHRTMVARASFFMLATADADGWPDVSYKGGQPGFVRIFDDGRTIAFPSYDGNGMYRSMGNIAASSKVGMLFIDFERPKRLRVNGVASLHDDAEMLALFPGAELVVAVAAEKIFDNCPRYVHTMTMTQISEYAPSATHVPPEPEWKQRADFQPYLPRT